VRCRVQPPAMHSGHTLYHGECTWVCVGTCRACYRGAWPCQWLSQWCVAQCVGGWAHAVHTPLVSTACTSHATALNNMWDTCRDVGGAWGVLYRQQGAVPGGGYPAKAGATHQTPPLGSQWCMPLPCTTGSAILASDSHSVCVRVHKGCTAHAAQQRVLCCTY